MMVGFEHAIVWSTKNKTSHLDRRRVTSTLMCLEKIELAHLHICIHSGALFDGSYWRFWLQYKRVCPHRQLFVNKSKNL